ncbi:MAG: CehA/McbA family metallohydrolase, partial [Flavisolibacter sp.]|nr:CehA/McbA family metallohydrolase [Flavisolibacter sp.]
IYPLPSRRLAATDEYPDFFFQPQVYRSDGEHVYLPPGKYTVTYTRGPEYLPQTKELVIPAGVTAMEATFQLKRWVNLEKLGWYSADHHIHAAGCSHYESPEEGVKPFDMWRQILGEDLNVGAVLAWGPGWYHQKEFFTGTVHPLSTKKNVMRYDVEVSGFPSSHAGHTVLLGLREDDYPGTTKIEDWPSWTLPELRWAKSQGAVTGYAHSGNGLQPVNEPSPSVKSPPNRNLQLPNYILPKMDGIGANEYIVTVVHDVVDFYSLGDTPAPWELNMWYHTLNCGFRPRLSGETDYPCVYDERVGAARSYFKPNSALDFNSFMDAIKKGRSYVSEGASHIINFSVNGLEAGTNNSELQLKGQQAVKITAKVAAYLPEQQDEDGAMIAQRPLDRQPYWNLERARIGKSRKVGVELIVNGEAVDTTEIIADGKWQDIIFQYPIKQSSWVALRIFPSSHTNPVFVLVDGKPIRILKSAQWCRDAVDQCWKMKQGNIRPEERTAAATGYDTARKVYDKIIQEVNAK